ncbi:unnamed protein product [Adineta steineri]|uniref:G-protein coupled receptors family 1 profile domain-containing protein n=1 Tax=Adineta steineri TaxID=433720 RepID=A0A819AB10_9BILA|nr:unnamed protein product [Adineta steineri]CAF3784812.1 unnamed protein product [Adineta steineri]
MNGSTLSLLSLAPLVYETSMDYMYDKDIYSPNQFNLTNSSEYLNLHRFVIRSLSVYALILVIIGTLGNLLTIIILCRRNLRRYVTMRYLIVVSICDIISLYGWNLNNFYKFTISSNNNNLEEVSMVHCRIMSYMTFVGLQLSSWCLTAVSLDRCLSLYFLTWKHKYGKLSRVKYHIAILAITCLLLNSHILFFNGYYIDTLKKTVKCYATRTNIHYIFPQWERVHLVVYNLCPFIIMLTCNTFIICISIRSARIRMTRRMTDASGKVSTTSTSRHRQLTIMLMLVTFMFVLLTLPSCVYFVFFRHRMPSTSDSRTFRHMVQICLGSIQFTAHAINFFLYCFSARNFREELHGFINELCCKRTSDFKSNRLARTSIGLTTFRRTKRDDNNFDSKTTLNHECKIDQTQRKLTNFESKDELNDGNESNSD